MFTRPDQLQRKGGPEERLSFLQKLKEEFSTTKSLDAKQQVLANLANFAYDPLNYPFIKQLHIIDLFLKEIEVKVSEELCAFAVGGLCNACNDPEIASYIISNKALHTLIELLEHRNQEIVLNSVTTLYYLARNEQSGYLLKNPVIYSKLRVILEANRSVDSRLSNIVAIFLHDIWDEN